MPATNLVLLTRSKYSRFETTLRPNQYHHTCWYEIYNWLDGTDTGEPVCEYLIQQFQGFLEEKGMSLNHITWEDEKGVKALLDLTAMMEAAVEVAFPDCKAKKTGGWLWRGYYLNDLQPVRKIVVCCCCAERSNNKQLFFGQVVIHWGVLRAPDGDHIREYERDCAYFQARLELDPSAFFCLVEG